MDSNTNQRIKIFIKQFYNQTEDRLSGGKGNWLLSNRKMFSLNVSPNEKLEALAMIIYDKRADKNKRTKFEDYERVIDYYYGDVKLDWTKTLKENNIRNLSVISEDLKDWIATSANVDFETLTSICPISERKIINPQNINCFHVFEKDAINFYMGMGNKYCPRCKGRIYLRN